MYTDYSPNESPFRNLPETSQCSTERNNSSNARKLAKTKIITTRSYLDGEKIKERRNYNLYQSGHGRTENDIINEYYEEKENNPFEIARNKPQEEENYEVCETYEKVGKNEKCRNYDNNYDDYQNYGKCKEQRGCLYCNFYECKYCQNILKSLDYDENCKKSRSPGSCRNYDYEYYEKCRNYDDNRGYDDYGECPKCKECLCCTYDCEYCKNLIENEDFRKNDAYEDRENYEYYRKFNCNKNKERCKSFKNFDNFRNYQVEEYEKYNKSNDKENSYDNCKRSKRCIYCNNYECDYCQDKKSNSKEDFPECENKEVDNNCNEIYRRCIMKRHASHNPTQIIYKTNRYIDRDEFQNLTMVINSPAKVIIYENEEDEKKNYNNKSYSLRKEVVSQVNQSNNKNTQDFDNKNYAEKYKNYSYKRQITRKPAQVVDYKRSNISDGNNYEKYYKKTTVKKEEVKEPTPSNYNYSIKREVTTRTTPDNKRTHTINDNKRSNKFYSNYAIRKEVTAKPTIEVKKSVDKNNNKNYNEYYKKYTVKRETINRPKLVKSNTYSNIKKSNYKGSYKNYSINREIDSKKNESYDKRSCDRIYKNYSYKNEVSPTPVSTLKNSSYRREVTQNLTPLYNNKYFRKEVKITPTPLYKKNYSYKREVTQTSTPLYNNNSFKKEVTKAPSSSLNNYSYRREVTKTSTPLYNNNSFKKEETKIPFSSYNNYSYRREETKTHTPVVRNKSKDKSENYESYQINRETKDVDTYNEVKRLESEVDNFKYKETKEIRNPRFKSIVVHKRMCTPTKQVKYIYNSGTNVRTNRSNDTFQRRNLNKDYNYSPNKVTQRTTRSLTRNKSYRQLVPNNSKEIFKRIETSYVVPQTTNQTTKKEVIEETIEDYKTNNDKNKNYNTYKSNNNNRSNKFEQYNRYEKYNKYNKSNTNNKSSDKYNKDIEYNKSYKYTSYNVSNNNDKNDKYNKAYKYTTIKKLDNNDKCGEYKKSYKYAKYNTYNNNYDKGNNNYLKISKYSKSNEFNNYDESNKYDDYEQCCKYTIYDECDSCNKCDKCDCFDDCCHRKCHEHIINIYCNCGCNCNCNCNCKCDCNCDCNCDCYCDSNCNTTKNIKYCSRNEERFNSKIRNSCSQSPKSLDDGNDEYLIKTRRTVKRITPDGGEEILEDKSFQTVEVYPKENFPKYKML